MMLAILCLLRRREETTNLLDISDSRDELLRDLKNDLLYERLSFHGPPHFHDAGRDKRVLKNGWQEKVRGTPTGQ